MADTSHRVAVVTGSNRGIGLAIVKRLCQHFDGIVYLTSRNEEKGKAAVAELNNMDLQPMYHQLDVVNRKSVQAFADYIKNTHGGLDILINNAAVASGVITNTYEEDKNIIEVNYRSILLTQELIFPLVRNNGRILNISSDCGHLSNIRNKYWIERLSSNNLSIEDINEFVDWYLGSVKNGTFKTTDFADNGTVAAYRAAKVAVSALTILQQKELAVRDISVNSMDPGLVRTDMTLGIGFLSADQAAEIPVYLVLEAPPTLRGAYVDHSGKVLDWYDLNSTYYFKSASFGTWLLPSVMSRIAELTKRVLIYVFHNILLLPIKGSLYS